MKKKIVLEFEDDELDALRKLAGMKFCGMEQAAMGMIRRELEERGFLKVEMLMEDKKTGKKYRRLDE